MIYSIMLLQADLGIPGKGIVRTVPMGLESRRALLKDLAAALLAEDIVAQTEILVKEERALGYPLVTVLALNLVGAVCSILDCSLIVPRICLRIEHRHLDVEWLRCVRWGFRGVCADRYPDSLCSV